MLPKAGMTNPKPIDTAPHREVIHLRLFCPEQGGWHTGI